MTGWHKHQRPEPVPPRFGPLATYNAEVARGIMHTPEWAAQMAVLQAEYGAWLEAHRLAPAASSEVYTYKDGRMIPIVPR